MAGVFSVVSGTTARFVSLVAAILGTSTFAFSVLYTSIPANAGQGRLIYARCGEIFQRHIGETDAADNLRLCLAPFEETQAAWLLAAVGSLLAFAMVLYLLTPWWIQRRSRLVALTGPRFSQLSNVLSELSTIAGLKAEPRFLLDPVAAAPGGLAFGRFGKHTVRLNAGLIPLRITNPAMFRAIVLHELAHIRNRDVGIAYATVALWRAFTVLALLPMVAVIVLPLSVEDYWQTLLHLGSRAAALVAVVYLIRNAVLRTREKYADARAASFGAAEGLRAAIARTKQAGVWRRRLGVHPAPHARLEAVDDPVSLLRPGFGEMFGAGLTTMIAAGTLFYFAALAVGAVHGGNVTWLLAPVAAGALGAAAWRAEVGSMRAVMVPAAIAFSLGCLVGDQLAVTNGAGRWGIFGTAGSAGQLPLPGSASVGGYSLLAAAAAAFVLTAGMICQAAVSAAGARAWLPRLRHTDTKWAWLAGVVATAIPLAIWLDIWVDLHTVPFLIGRTYHITVAGSDVPIWQGPAFDALTTFYPPLGIFENHPLAIPAVMLAWLYPFAALTVSGLRRAVVIGLWVSAGFAVAVLTARAATHLFAADLAATPGFAPYFTFSVIGLAIAAQAVAGGLTALAGKPFGVLLGQFSAFIAAICATFIILGSGFLGGCVPAFELANSSCAISIDSGHAGYLLRRIVIEGALAALIAATLMKITARFTLIWRTTAIAATLALAVATLSFTSATSAFSPVPEPSIPGSGPVAVASPRSPLTTAELEIATRAFTVGLPSYWAEEASPVTKEGTTFGSAACLAIARNTFIDTLDPQKHSTATVYLTNGGSLAISVLDMTISSYLVPVPPAIFGQAQAAQAACPAMTATTQDGFQVAYQLTAADPPRLGDQAWRVNMTFSPVGSSQATGTLITVMVRIGHTLITASTYAINEPVDETVFLEAVARAAAAIS